MRGLSTALNVTGGEAADQLTVDTLGGADVFDFTGFAGGLALRVNGGTESDRFLFGPGTHANVQILEFQAHSLNPVGADVVSLTGFVDHSFAAAVANHHIFEVDGSVVIADTRRGSDPWICPFSR